MLKTLYNIFLSSLAVIMAAPTIAIIVTWKTVPGEELYPLKRSLENAVLIIVSPSYRARTNLQLTLIDRRVDEVNSSIFKMSPLALPELTEQAKAAKNSIQDTTSTDLQVENAQKLNLKLRDANNDLEYNKLYLKNTVNDPDAKAVVKEIDRTKSQLIEVIEEL